MAASNFAVVFVGTLALSIVGVTRATTNVSNGRINVVIDLSHWNENVDFKLVKEDGILGVIYKATQGLTYVDPTYAERRTAAEEEGLLWGAYHFGTGENGKEQADHFLQTVGNTDNVLLVLDVEANPSGTTITPTQAEDFVDEVREVTGRLPVIYGGSSFLESFSTSKLTKCPLWLARYGKEPTLPKGWDRWILWQYTNGKDGAEPHEVQGIGPCDRDLFNGTVEELTQTWVA